MDFLVDGDRRYLPLENGVSSWYISQNRDPVYNDFSYKEKCISDIHTLEERVIIMQERKARKGQ
jgi:hypothetical protein